MSRSVFVGFCIRYFFFEKKNILRFSTIYGNYDAIGNGGIWRNRQAIIMFFILMQNVRNSEIYLKFCKQA